MQEIKREFVGRSVRKTIDFHPGLYEQIRAHAKKRSCQSFGEAVRDLVRIAFDRMPLIAKKKGEKNDHKNTGM